MSTQTKLLDPLKISTTTLAIGVFEQFEMFEPLEIPPGFDKQIEIIRNEQRKIFSGKSNEIATLFSSLGLQQNHPHDLVLLGLGKRDKFSADSIRDAYGSLGAYCRDKSLDRIGIIPPRRRSTGTSSKGDTYSVNIALMEGLFLGAYRFNKYKSKNSEKEFKFDEITIYFRTNGEKGMIKNSLELATVSAEMTNLGRDLTNAPSNALTPSALAAEASGIAKRFGLKCNVIRGNSLVKNRLNGILAVGKGSSNPPNLIILEYVPGIGSKTKSASRPLVLIGKGVTFDSGGISIKPGEKMDQMRNDMAGGAAVITALAGLAALRVPQRTIGLIPAVENLPSGTATKPGDIIQYMNGKFIEILNTDAEGRLILADALAFAQRYDPLAVVDIATLTGACVVALGHNAAGLMGNDNKLMTAIEKSASSTGEKVWRLPLWEPYREEMKGDFADLKNVSGREGGAINAAAFLLEFAEKYKWAHIDIAGMAWTEKSRTFNPKGATGFGTRLLLNLAKNLGERRTQI